MSTSYRKPWDFFISYASEDRESAANPLANALTSRGFSVWLDHQVLDKDDRLEKQIESGLTQCHAGIVIVSPHFVRKDWPLRELDTLLGVETLDGRLRVVPVLYNLTASQLQDTAPTLCQRATIDLAEMPAPSGPLTVAVTISAHEDQAALDYEEASASTSLAV